MFLEQDEQSAAASSPARSGKDEMNFAEFPIALLTDRAPKGQKSIRFEDQIYDERRKKVITRRRVIEGSEEYGLPTATDDTVILALIQLTKLKTEFTEREVEFSRLELIKMLGWPNEGKSYDRIKLSLQRIANVTYNYDNAWWDGRQKTWTTKIFHIIETAEINDSRDSDGQGGLFKSRIVWNEVVFNSFQAGFLRNIDFQLCMCLKYPTALRMYRFLGKRFHHKPDWTFDLKEFAHDHIGLGRNYEGGTQIARKLQPALTELEKVGFLEPMGEDERFPKHGRDWQIRFVQKGAPLDAPLPIPELSEPPAQSGLDVPQLATELTLRGVTRATALGLVDRYPSEFLESKIDVFDFLTEKQDKRIARSPAGYLVKSIENDYAAPKSYVSKAERERREEALKAKERQAAQERRRQQQEDARQKEEQAAIVAYWESLTPEQQSELDEAAKAQADAETLALETGPFKRFGKQIRRDNYIRQLLKNQKPVLVEA